MEYKYLFLCFCILFRFRLSSAASCQLVLPIEESTGSDVGIIMLPGANYPGQLYEPLAKAVQEALPEAKIWFGLTRDYILDTPNPLEVGGAIADCRNKANEAQLGGPLYLAGHSLGGVMGEQYLQDENNLANFAGVILYGSYLTDFFLGDNNTYPVPALTVIGSLDGLALSYLLRERRESMATSHFEQYPVYVASDCTHAQVASGPIPDFVKDRDIQPEISEAEAHKTYAEITTTFLILQNQDLFGVELISGAQEKNDVFDFTTQQFLAPFEEASLMEVYEESSEWMLRGQKILVTRNNDEDLSGLEVIDLVVPFDDLGETKPSVVGENCSATVTTYATPQYDWDIADAGVLQSATVLKAKFKLEDNVREALCLPPMERKQCKDINMEAFEVALSLASVKARERFLAHGTKLFFLDDSVSPWGPGWEYSFGLHYTNVNSTHTSLYSTSLISEPDFFIQSAAGMHYCDLLSPYRALEWIYLTSVVGKEY